MTRPAVTDHQAAAFIAACLDPVPLGKKTLVCRMLARETKERAENRWFIAMAEVEHFSHLKEAMFHGRLACATKGEQTNMSERDVEAPLRAAVNRMLLTPAPRKACLAFKRKWLRFAGDKEAASRAIAADEARLGVAP